MDRLIDFLNGFNIQTLLGMGLMLLYFTREMRKEHKEDIDRIEKRNEEISKRTEVISKRTDDLYMMFIKLLEKKQ